MGSPGEPPTGRIYPDCTCAWKVPDVRCPWHGTPTPPAPSDDARERGLAAYDALTMQEQSEISAQHPRYCYAKGYVAALAGRAADASGAEAMRERAATVLDEYAKNAATLAETKPDGGFEDRREEFQGTASILRAIAAQIRRLPIPARDDAVEEAAEALCDYLDKTSGGEEWKGSSLVRRLRAALRRENRGDQPKAGHDEGDSPRRGA